MVAEHAFRVLVGEGTSGELDDIEEDEVLGDSKLDTRGPGVALGGEGVLAMERWKERRRRRGR